MAEIDTGDGPKFLGIVDAFFGCRVNISASERDRRSPLGIQDGLWVISEWARFGAKRVRADGNRPASDCSLGGIGPRGARGISHYSRQTLGGELPYTTLIGCLRLDTVKTLVTSGMGPVNFVPGLAFVASHDSAIMQQHTPRRGTAADTTCQQPCERRWSYSDSDGHDAEGCGVPLRTA
jgi:hypothetical protein